MNGLDSHQAQMKGSYVELLKLDINYLYLDDWELMKSCMQLLNTDSHLVSIDSLFFHAVFMY